MKEVLSIDVNITKVDTVKGSGREAIMIHFGGSCDCELFKGVILPGGVDTQYQEDGGRRTLSARYVLEGKDNAGKDCQIFIENNGTTDEDGKVKETIPKIVTDSETLSFLQTAQLRGTIEGKEGGVIIHICEVD
ncbi:MAG: DUF3237 family protein [Butyrivibrio sp.]|nr:DUF3237 family protein [Butyrivibrio sp.]